MIYDRELTAARAQQRRSRSDRLDAASCDDQGALPPVLEGIRAVVCARIGTEVQDRAAMGDARHD
jgi:hypothetical protein